MHHDLTPRECEVTRLITLGCTTREVAAIIGVTPSTVDTHRTSAMRKLGVRKTALLTRKAIKCRITKVNDRLTKSEKRKQGKPEDGWN